MIEQVDRFLTALLDRAVPDGRGVRWPEGWGKAEAALVAERIRFHGIAWHAAGRAGADWPAIVRNGVHEEARQQVFWEESHAQVVRATLAGLAEAQIEALVLKGTALAYSLHPVAAARRRGDTDLLVRTRDVPRARQVLHACGFQRRRSPQGLQFQETWLYDTGIGFVHALDLHWRLGESPVFRQALDVADCFVRSQPLPALGEAARMPAFLHTFIHGAFNQAWHGRHGYLVEGERMTGPGRLIWMQDNALLMQAFCDQDWHDLVQSAVAHGSAPVCLAALEQTGQCLGVAAPDAVLQALRKAPQDTGVVQRLESLNQVECFVADLRALPGWREKAQFIRTHAAPSADHLRAKYPARSGWPIPLLYLRWLAETGVRWRRLRAS